MTTTAASTISPSASRPLSPSWSPSPNDHLIFKWIKLEGKSQSWVASAFGISQPTVSRIIQRYERWQAHATDREDGRLDHSERLRAQRWLTYERNELFLSSCLRIAQEMEGFTEVSKETVSRSTLHPNDPGNFRTETANIDRSGVAARFYRLAFRINMEQLKLASLDPAPLALPLSADELAALEIDALTTAQEFEHAKNRADQQAQGFANAGFAPPSSYPTPETADTYKPDPFAWPAPPPPPTDPAGWAPPTTSFNPQPQAQGSHEPDFEPETSNSTADSSSTLPPSEISNHKSLIPNLQSEPAPSPTLNLEPGTLNSPLIHPVNNLNNTPATEIAATSIDKTNYEFPPAPENFSTVNNDYPSNIPLAVLVPPAVANSPPEPPALATTPSLPFATELSIGISGQPAPG